MAEATEQSVALGIIGATSGEQVHREGLAETARRLTHCLAEIAAVLDTNYRSAGECRVRRQEASEKAKATLREWGVT